MNFEKWMKKRGNNKLNAYAKNPYHVSWIKRMPLWSKVAVPAALAMTAAVVVISVGVLPHLGMNKGAASKAMNSEAQYSSYTPASQAGSKDYTPGSQAQSTMDPGEGLGYNSYLHFSYQGTTYDYSNITVDSSKGGSNIQVGPLIDTITLTYSNNQSKEVKICAFPHIDPEVAVIICDVANDGTGGSYSIYFNESCHFHDIDDFVNLLSPATEIKIQKILYYDLTISDDKQAQYSSSSDTEIYDILFADGSIEGYTAMDYDYESSYKYYYIGFNIPAFVDYRFTGYFFDSGYIVFNLLGQNHIFELGQETYQTFASYVTSH